MQISSGCLEGIPIDVVGQAPKNQVSRFNVSSASAGDKSFFELFVPTGMVEVLIPLQGSLLFCGGTRYENLYDRCVNKVNLLYPVSLSDGVDFFLFFGIFLFFALLSHLLKLLVAQNSQLHGSLF